VIDFLGGPALAGNLTALANRGRLVLVGLLGGTAAPLDLNVMLRKRLTIVGTTLRARPLEEKLAATRRFAEQIVPWLARGLVRPVVDSIYQLEAVRDSQVRMESNEVFGKVILRV
jgi:NADPH:quinone reductase